jgi:hypothetical protein
LTSPTVSVFFPFLVLPSNPYFARCTIASPPSLLPADVLPHITRKQLIDALVTLSKARTLIMQHQHIEKSVIELCLEYIGRRWRETGGRAGERNLVDLVAKKLIEVEFEVSNRHTFSWKSFSMALTSQLQCQGDPSTVRSTILPVIRRVRFLTGIVPSLQLVSRLNSSSEPDSPDHIPADRRQLVIAWITRRLNAGGDPQRLAEEVVSLCYRVRHDPTRQMVTRLLVEIGLERSNAQVNTGEYNEFGILSPPPPVLTPSLSKRKPFSFLSPKAAARRTLPGPTKWFGHKRSDSSSSRLVPPGFDPDRRPSLPTISVPHLPGTAFAPLSPRMNIGSTVSLSTSDHTIIPQSPRSPGSVSTAPTRLTPLVAATEPDEIRTALLDHLLEMRYHLSGQEETGWFLGDGKHVAVDIIDALENKVKADHDSLEVGSIFSEVRATFNLRQPSEQGLSSLLDRGKPRRGSDDPRVYSRNLASPFSDGGVSFDLDQYIRDISHDGLYKVAEGEEELVDEDTASRRKPRRVSVGASSLLSLSSRMSTDTRGDRLASRSSTLSGYAYSIREAKKQMPLEAVAVERPRAIKSSKEPDTEDPLALSPKRTSYRAFRSTPNLLDPYTILPPPVGSIRRRNAPSSLPRSISDRLPLNQRLPDTPTSIISSSFSSPNLASRIPDDLLALLSSVPGTPESLPSTPLPGVGKGFPNERANRHRNRHCAIVDLVEVSPSKGGWEQEGFFMTPTTPEDSANNSANITTCKVSPNTPLQRKGSLTPIPLASIISLFTKTPTQRTPDQVERALTEFVEREKERCLALGLQWEGEPRRRAAWLMTQVSDLVHLALSQCLASC